MCDRQQAAEGTGKPVPEFAQLFETALFKVGEFRCPGQPPVTTPETAPLPEIVLPRKGAYVRRDESGAVYLDRTVTAFFEAGRPYVIEHLRPKPDLTTVISLSDEGELAASLGFPRRGQSRFARAAVRTSADVHLAHAALIRALAKGSDMLAIEECAVTLVWRAAALTQAVPELARVTRSADARWRHDIAIATADYLNAHFRRPLRLQQVADHIGYSVFHLCRLFQAEMGRSIHKYLLELRLEAAMAELAESDRAITGLAFDLGFCSASHFTGQFTRWAGMPPREARRRVRAGSKIAQVFPPSTA